MATDRPRRSLRLRITAVAVAVVGVVLLLGGLGLVWGLHEVLLREARATAAGRAAEAARVVQAGGDAAAAVAGDDVLVQVLDPAGAVLVASGPAADRPALPRLAPGESRVVELSSDDGRYLVVAAPAGVGVVLVAQSLDTVDEPIRALGVLLAAGLPAVLLLVAAVTWSAVGRALAPVTAISAEVDAISAAELHRRVPRPAVDDEVGRLADTMNRSCMSTTTVRGFRRRTGAGSSTGSSGWTRPGTAQLAAVASGSPSSPRWWPGTAAPSLSATARSAAPG